MGRICPDPGGRHNSGDLCTSDEEQAGGEVL
jgi:hypothetical protein